MNSQSEETETPTPTQSEPVVDDDPGTLGERIVTALCSVFDPEIPVNIYELGLIYDVKIEEDQSVAVKMTLTSPHCPVAESLPGDVRRVVAEVPGVASADVEVVWDPSWNPGMMSEAAKLELGMF
jgi:FeS assembly SUF system protein